MYSTQFLVHNLVVFVLVINAIFWGLYPHSSHCALVKYLGSSKCPSHIYHVVFGILCFLVAVWIEQGNFFNPNNWK